MSQKKKGNWVARILDSDTVKRIAPGAWLQWRTTTDSYRGIGYRQGELPPESGDLLVQQPYADWYNLTYGLAPNQDMPKWRWMFRAREEIRRGIDTKVILAVGKPPRIVCDKSLEIEEFANRLMDRLRVRETLQGAVTDALVYGQAYFEKVRVVNNDEQKGEALEDQAPDSRHQAEITRKWRPNELDVNTEDPNGAKKAVETLKNWVEDIQKVDEWLAKDETRTHFEGERKRYLAKKARFSAADIPNKGSLGVADGPEAERIRKELTTVSDGELVELKPLDPLWMRINRDAFGNVLGFVQWGLTAIPQSIPPEKIVFIRWMPKSWAFESAYGTSILMPVQRHVSFLIQAEEDMKIYWHQYAKPMLVVNAGTEDKPYPMAALSSLKASFQNRQPNTDAIVPGDVKVNILKGGTGDTTSTFKEYVTYLREKIADAMGIPAALQNMPQQTVRATSDVSLQGFIAEERMIQEMIGEYFLKEVIEPEVRRVFGDKIPLLTLTWAPILEDDRNKKADRLVKSIGVPFMTVNEGRTEMGLKSIDDPKYDDLAPAAQPGFGQLSKGPEPSATTQGQTRDEGLQKRDKSP